MARASLGELIGKGNNSVSLDNLGEVLGERMPELPRNAIGRNRLIQSLRHRFGDQFRNIPGVKQAIADFDEEVRFAGVLYDMKNIKPKGRS